MADLEVLVEKSEHIVQIELIFFQFFCGLKFCIIQGFPDILRTVILKEINERVMVSVREVDRILEDIITVDLISDLRLFEFLDPSPLSLFSQSGMHLDPYEIDLDIISQTEDIILTFYLIGFISFNHKLFLI